VAVATCATIWLGAAELGVFRVCDLSAGGALLEGSCPAPAGQALTASFHFSSFEIEVGAVVARNERPRVARFALRFEVMSPEARDWLRTLVLDMRDSGCDASELILAESPDKPGAQSFGG
jgi:hypothetical protein